MIREEDVLRCLQKKGSRPLLAEELAAQMQVGRDDLPAFFALLAELEKRGLLFCNRKGAYCLPEQAGLLRGKIQGNARGYAFFLPDDAEVADVFVGPEQLNGAMHNDVVLLRLLPERRGRRNAWNGDKLRREGEVLRVLFRANRRLLGIYCEEDGRAFLRPEEKRLGESIAIRKGEGEKAAPGERVLAEICRWPSVGRGAEARLIERLGLPEAPGVDMLSVIRKYALPERFPNKLLRAAESLAHITPEDLSGRLDLRESLLVTIDGEDAKDLDDAVSLEKRPDGGWRLGVHIADVGHYVPAASPLDREAFARATSVYLPDRVLPMLPPALSNGICSLNAGEDRLALSCLMELDAEGGVESFHVVESCIRVRFRMSYEAANVALAGDGPEGYLPYLSLLREMCALSELLRQKRMRRGALDFDFPEAKLLLDENGQVLELKKKERGQTERVIEEFMILANEEIAAHFSALGLPFLYRVHSAPPTAQLLELNLLLAPFGYFLPLGNGEKVSPLLYQKLLQETAGKPEARLLAMTLLRSLSHAAYQAEPAGHFGLASGCYTHFTSPIRRYPDLAIHRVIKDYLHGTGPAELQKKWAAKMPAYAAQSSQQERVAEDAEREALDRKRCAYLAARQGECFSGYISGVTEYGLYVELDNTAEGMLHVSALEDDYYIFDRQEQALCGRHLGKRYRLGDRITVQVGSVNLEEGYVDFLLPESTK